MGSMLEEVQERYQQHHHSCFLYLASEVIKVNLFVWSKQEHLVWKACYEVMAKH